MKTELGVFFLFQRDRQYYFDLCTSDQRYWDSDSVSNLDKSIPKFFHHFG
ncbi:hypothetical protein N9Y33_01315 [Bacteroidia bacterium]|nr:hypothetical protein [Bacteroidia bacterium]